MRRTERSKLKPSDNQLLEKRSIRVAACIPSNVCRPERDAGDPCLLTCLHCGLQLVKVRPNVAGPQRSAVRLRAGPPVAGQDEIVVFTSNLLELVL